MPGQSLDPVEAYRYDIDGSFELTKEQVELYQENGFIRLKEVFKPRTLEHIQQEITGAVRAADTTPLENDDAYAKAFLQVMNLWLSHEGVREFCFGKKLARIAAQLMKVASGEIPEFQALYWSKTCPAQRRGYTLLSKKKPLQTSGVRMYHDQALYKEPHGGAYFVGPTPWHCDQYYWPLNTTNTITAWIPLQPVPLEMGTLEFAAGTHKTDLGRALGISGDNDNLIALAVQNGGFHVERAPFDIGEVSFHSGYTFHRADGNSTGKPRQVMTIIMMDENARLIEAQHDNHRADMERFLPGLKAGDLAASERNPVLWSSNK